MIDVLVWNKYTSCGDAISGAFEYFSRKSIALVL